MGQRGVRSIRVENKEQDNGQTPPTIVGIKKASHGSNCEGFRDVLS